MTNPNLTMVVVVLDRSGSMAMLQEATLEGLNAFLDTQRNTPGEALIHLAQFDNKYDVIYPFRKLHEVANVTPEVYVPRGSTALMDAIGRSISEVGAHLASLSEEDRPGKVLFVVQTDGAENASREFSREQIFGMIDHQRSKYGWEFLFLGANQDAIKTGASLGIAGASSITYSANPVATRAVFSSTGRLASDYRTGAIGSAAYTNADRLEAMLDVDYKTGHIVPKVGEKQDSEDGNAV